MVARRWHNPLKKLATGVTAPLPCAGMVLILGLVAALFLSRRDRHGARTGKLRAFRCAEGPVSAGSVSDQLRVVIWDIRMPIALMAVTVGASLSVAGAQMQTILANPLASPFTLGISAAASFGAALGACWREWRSSLSPSQFMVPINAFLMAMLAALFIHFASTMRGVTVETIVLLGIALVFTFNALLSLLEYLASEQALAAVVFWTMGSLTKATWPRSGSPLPYSLCTFRCLPAAPGR